MVHGHPADRLEDVFRVPGAAADGFDGEELEVEPSGGEGA
jgi:hypothetical protein